jgi:hypothetical protein
MVKPEPVPPHSHVGVTKINVEERAEKPGRLFVDLGFWVIDRRKLDKEGSPPRNPSAAIEAVGLALLLHGASHTTKPSLTAKVILEAINVDENIIKAVETLIECAPKERT